MKHINIPVPENLIEGLTKALKDVVKPCPKHQEHRKRLVALDECQHGLLLAIERMGFGEMRIIVEQGRPAGMLVTQSFRFGKDTGDVAEQLAWLAGHLPEEESKILKFGNR